MRGAPRGATVALAAAVAAVGLVACNDPPADTVSPAAQSRPVPTAVAGTAATGAPSPSSEVPALPASELPALPGYAYAVVPGVPETVPELDGDYVSGYVGRAVRRGDADAGVVQLVRLRRVTPTTDAFVDGFVEQYAQTTAFRAERLAGERVRTSSRLRGRPGGLVTWRSGRDLVLVYSASGLADAKRVARAYLAAD